PTDAESSGLERVAITSPAATRSPTLTEIVAMWPLTSGAILISVVRTMPTIGGAGVGRRARSASVPTTAASTRAPPMRRLTRSLDGMGGPPAANRGARNGEHEIGQHQGEDAEPVVRDIGEAGAHLVDSHQPVDAVLGREDLADEPHRRRNRLDRPGDADEEELRQRGGEEEHDSRFAMTEPGRGGLAHEAR